MKSKQWWLGDDKTLVAVHLQRDLSASPVPYLINDMFSVTLSYQEILK